MTDNRPLEQGGAMLLAVRLWKDRSGRLDPIEAPHLGRLFEKIRSPARPIAERLALPAPTSTPAV